MESFLATIKEDAEKMKITFEKLGNLIGVTKAQVSFYLNGSNHIVFEKFLTIIQFLYEDVDKINSLLLKYALSLNETKIRDIRKTIEFLYNHGRSDYVKKIVKVNKKDSYAKVYSIILARNERKINSKGFLVKLEELKYQNKLTEDTKLLISTYMLYAYSANKAYSLVPILSFDLLNTITKMKETYITKSLTYKVKESIAFVYLKQNQLGSLRELAKTVINDSENYPLSKVYMLALLSESYVFSSYTLSMYYLTKAINNYNKLGGGKSNRRQRMLEATHDFINIYHKHFENLFLTDPAEKAHYLFSTQESKNIKQAFKIIEEIKEKNEGKLSPHQQYYIAMGTGDYDLMKQCLIEFERNGDIFYTKLPKRHLLEKDSSNSNF
jgi:transcriptional regulator with XRE-family HTH domain